MNILMGIISDLNRPKFQVSVLLTESPKTAQILSPKNFLAVYEIVVGVSVGGIHALFGCGLGSRHPSRLHMTSLEEIYDRVMKLYVAVLFGLAASVEFASAFDAAMGANASMSRTVRFREEDQQGLNLPGSEPLLYREVSIIQWTKMMFFTL